jgi:hypothetical protein
MPVNDKPFSLTHQELATVLASLRIMQSCTADHIANMFHFDDCEPLDNDAIDDLCERLNFDMPVAEEDDEEDDDAGKECTCDDRSWYGDQHDSACDFAGEDRV